MRAEAVGPFRPVTTLIIARGQDQPAPLLRPSSQPWRTNSTVTSTDTTIDSPKVSLTEPTERTR